MKQIIKWTLPVTLSITIICCAILFSLFFKGLYYWDIGYLSITDDTHISQDEIKENYSVLIEYLTDSKVDKLEFPSFSMSKEGEIHFVDVKNIFTVIKWTMYILGIYSLAGILFNILTKQYKFLKHTAAMTIGLPLSLLLVAMLDFSKVFIIFHELVFSNDYWIFDPVTDPVITILPEAFFLHSFLLIVSMIFIITILLMLLYTFIKRR